MSPGEHPGKQANGCRRGMARHLGRPQALRDTGTAGKEARQQPKALAHRGMRFLRNLIDRGELDVPGKLQAD